MNNRKKRANPADRSAPTPFLSWAPAPAPRYWTHKRVSYLKSAVRIKACLLAMLMPTATAGVIVLALGLIAAEWIGIWEETDARG